MNRLTKAAIAILFLLCAGAAAHAQCVITTVSGTITDPNGLPYSYASVTAALQPASQSPTCGGSPIGGVNHTQADVNGTFSMPVAANTSISPGGTTWVFTVQANSGLPAPVGKGTQTFSTTGITITGTAQSLTSTLTALATALTVPLNGGGAGNFGTLAGGTNTTATMLVGSGATLGFTGTGTVNANILDNVVLSGTPAAGDCPVATTSIAGSWVLCPTVSGSLTQGFPLIGTGTQMQAVPYPLNASLFAGSDPGVQLQNALNACPTSANTLCLVDASSIPTTNVATVNPYANVNAIGATSAVILIQLPCQPIQTNVIWFVNKNDVITRGCGLHSANAEITNTTSLPANSPVIQIGDGVTNHLIFNSRFEDLRIAVTGGGNGGSYGFNGQLLNERAGLWRVNIIGANSGTATNPLVKCTGCAHEILSDLELANAGANDALLLDGINVVQQAEGDVSNITLNNTGGGTGVQGTNGIHIQDTGATGNTFYAVWVKNIHAENFAVAVNFDSQSAGMWSMVDCSSSCTTGVIRNTNGFVEGDSFGSQLGGFTQYSDQITGASLPDTTFLRVNHLSGGPGAEILGGTIQPTAAKSTAYTLSYFDGQITDNTTNQITIPHAYPGTLYAKFPWVVINSGSGSLPLGCDSGNTNGSASPASLPGNQMAIVGTDGTNCYALFGNSGGSNPLTAIGQVYVGGASGTPTAAPAGITGQALTATNAATPAFSSPGLSDSANSPITSASYPIACDSSTTIIDRVHTLRFQSGASTPVVPLSSASGCGVGFVTTVIDDGAGSLVFGRTSADTFSVFNGSTASDSQTSFTLTNGQYATLNVAAAGVWNVRITAGAAAGISNTTFTNATTAISGNACSASAVTVTLTGLATTSTLIITPSTDVSASVGWGSTGGLVIDAWPSATNTMSYKICNQTASSITPGAVVWNVGAK